MNNAWNIIANPNAKINLGLHITAKRTDGYHNIETVFYPIELFDEVSIKIPTEHADFEFELQGLIPDSKAGENLVEKAYHLLASDFKLPPVSIRLKKQIPVGAGLGGGSSDAAFTLKCLNELFSIGLSNSELEYYASKIGADCAFFIRNKPVFATGIGNEFIPIDINLAGFYWQLLKPDIHISTAQAYANIVPVISSQSLLEIIRQPVSTWKYNLKNDFESTVFKKFPQISAIKDELYNSGALYASMSGSGSSVFGIYENKPEKITMFDNSLVFVGNF